ncbi:hypothetical protein [Paralimibaculum aggregatum]|uniref:hypothetical protein n=1 Tax=Paralimibaculum aggregatum TaxID=3036245 RepID=UPI0025566FC5|nr:hypothetical protein [Limibaculum sp. NKW23]
MLDRLTLEGSGWLLVPLGLYLAALGLIAAVAARRNAHTVEDHYIANRTVGYAWLVGTTVASLFNALAITGTPALFYSGGILFLQLFPTVLGVTILMWTFGTRIASDGRRWGGDHPGGVFRALLRLPHRASAGDAGRADDPSAVSRRADRRRGEDPVRRRRPADLL